MRWEYLTFDCYGTLIDWRKGIEDGLRAAVGELAIGGRELLQAYVAAERREESGRKKYREVLRDTAVALSGVLGVRVGSKAAEEFAGSLPGWPAFPDSGGFLREIGARGHKRYILSNVDDDLLRQTIDRNGFEVDGFVTAEEVGSYKPRPGHWIEFMARTGARRDEVLHVAQSVFHDIVPAQLLGLESAWVNRYSEPLPRDAYPSLIAESLSSLSKVIG